MQIQIVCSDSSHYMKEPDGSFVKNRGKLSKIQTFTREGNWVAEFKPKVITSEGQTSHVLRCNLCRQQHILRDETVQEVLNLLATQNVNQLNIRTFITAVGLMRSA